MDFSASHSTPIYNEILLNVEGKIPYAQATAPTSGKKLILEVAHLGDGFVPLEEHYTENPKSLDPGIFSAVSLLRDLNHGTTSL